MRGKRVTKLILRGLYFSQYEPAVKQFHSVQEICLFDNQDENHIYLVAYERFIMVRYSHSLFGCSRSFIPWCES